MATTFTLKIPDRLPVGATVDVYPATNWRPWQSPSGAPIGSRTTTGTVGADGTLALTGLAEGTDYYAYTSTPDRYVHFTTEGAGATVTPSDATVTSAKIAAKAVTSDKVSDTLRFHGWVPKDLNANPGIAENVIGRGAATSLTLTGGTLRLAGGLVIPAGRTVTAITLSSSGTAASGPTHQWLCLVAQDLTLLATTEDLTSAAWGANTAKTFRLASTLGGADHAGSYTPTVNTEVYVGLVVTASTTVPNVVGASGTTGLVGLSPVTSATSNTGLTDPASLVSALSSGKVGALTVAATPFYAFVS